MISLSDPVLGKNEKNALCSVIDSQWLTMGERVAAFEKAFALLHKMDDAVAVSSCTAGLHLALIALGISAGDEVLLPSETFVATSNAVLYVGATPIFVDIVGPDEPHISIDDAENKCTERTKAVIIMHYGGYLVDTMKWRSFAQRKGIFLIEDAAHAPAIGNVGQCSTLSVFSFFSNKNMTTAEGGMVLSPDSLLLDKIRSLRSHGMTTLTLERHRGHAHSYDVNMLGYNYRLDELRAAIGLVQLERLQSWNRRRKELLEIYRYNLLEHVPTCIVPFNDDHETAAHLMPVLLPVDADRKKIMDQLRTDGIQTSIHYPPVHRFEYYKKLFPNIQLPQTDIFSYRELTLPLHPNLSVSQIEYIITRLGCWVQSDE